MEFLQFSLFITSIGAGFVCVSKYIDSRNYQNSNLVIPAFLTKINNYISLRYLFFLVYSIFFSLSLLFKYYFASFMLSLVLLNLYMQQLFITYLLYVCGFFRILYSFYPFTDILEMKISFESFSFFFCIFSYIFFIKHHKIIVLWISSFFRILLGLSIEEEIGVVYSMWYGLKTQNLETSAVSPTNTPPTSPRTYTQQFPSTPHQFFNNIEKHQHAAIMHDLSALKQLHYKPYHYDENILKYWEQVYFDKAVITAEDEAKFLQFGIAGRLLGNSNKLAIKLGSDEIVQPWAEWEDGYRKEYRKQANKINVVEPAKTLITIDWPDAQENEEFIAIKAFVHTHFSGEKLKIMRGYNKVDFTIKREDGTRLFIDVTSPSEKSIANFRESYLANKLEKLYKGPRKSDESKLLLYNFAKNSDLFLNAPKLDNRILIVTNQEIQYLFDAKDIKINFAKERELSKRLITFKNISLDNLQFTSPREQAIKQITFIQKW